MGRENINNQGDGIKWEKDRKEEESTKQNLNLLKENYTFNYTWENIFSFQVLLPVADRLWVRRRQGDDGRVEHGEKEQRIGRG